MGSRTISVPDDVYEKLQEERRPDESFGNAIDRLLGRRDLAEFRGAWDEGTAANDREAITEARARSDDRLERLYD